jgi:hypothetical protein
VAPRASGRAPSVYAHGGGARGGERPTGDRAQGSEGRRGFGDTGSSRGNMTPEEWEARRKQFEERLKNMSPEERERWEARMREGRRGRGDNPATGSSGPGGRGGAGQSGPSRASRGGTPAAGSQQGSRITNSSATTIDALFAPIPPVEGRGRVWLFINKQLKPVALRTGITDGTWTEILETPDTAQLQPGAEVVTNVVTGLESQSRPGQQGTGSNPLMPQRGQPGRGPAGGGRGR